MPYKSGTDPKESRRQRAAFVGHNTSWSLHVHAVYWVALSDLAPLWHIPSGADIALISSLSSVIYWNPCCMPDPAMDQPTIIPRQLCNITQLANSQPARSKHAANSIRKQQQLYSGWTNERTRIDGERECCYYCYYIQNLSLLRCVRSLRFYLSTYYVHGY